MRTWSRRVLPLIAAPMLSSCVFLLDYDALQSGGATPNEAGAPTAGADGAGTSNGGSNPGSSEGGAAPSAGGVDNGGAPACGSCDDQDPCTVDSCDSSGDAPECVHEPEYGLQPDGFEQTLREKLFARVSLVAGGGSFYLADLESDGTNPDVSLYRLETDGTELVPLDKVSGLGLDATVVSNVGLTLEPLALGKVALHGFVAAKPRTAASPVRVFHLVNRGDRTLTNAIAGSSYKADNPSVFPQAITIGGQVFGAWIQTDGTISVHDNTAVSTQAYGATTLPASTLSLLSTSSGKPGVMFTAQNGSKMAAGVYVETAGMNRVKLPECETRPGDYVSSTVIDTQIPGLWLANVTRAGDGYLTNQGGSIVCGAGSCATAGDDCSKVTLNNGVRDVAGATIHSGDDPPDVLYSVLAVPQIALGSDAIEATLSLALGRTDFSTPAKPDSVTIGGAPDTGLLEIARMPTDAAAGFAGPDWPALAISDTKQVAVAWIQPGEAGGSELRIQRYKMCLPPP